MSIKDSLKVFRHDLLAHYQWASWFATGSAVVALAACLVGTGLSVGVSCLAGAAASMATAVLAGFAGEGSDRADNELAEIAGDPAPHEVSRADILASAIGGLPSAIPLAFVGLVLAAGASS